MVALGSTGLGGDIGYSAGGEAQGGHGGVEPIAADLLVPGVCHQYGQMSLAQRPGRWDGQRANNASCRGSKGREVTPSVTGETAASARGGLMPEGGRA